jgi:hypothetical protein
MASTTPQHSPLPYSDYRLHLACARAWLSEGRNFAVQGARRSGKTAFLSKVTTEWQQGHTNGIVLWLDLDARTTTSVQIGERIAKALGYTSDLNENRDDTKLQLLREKLLAAADLIIVLDDVNSMAQANAVWGFSRVAPRLLVGARDGLNLPQVGIIRLSQLESESTFTESRVRHFKVEYALIDATGEPSALYYDLSLDRKKRLRRIERLTDDFLYVKKELPWPRGPEGRWILVPLRGDVALCQWDPGNAALWELGFEVGRLKVVRIVRRNAIPVILEAYAPADPDE